MEPRSMFDLFIKFGVVKDVFIPQKRRKTTNTRFGFVRFDYPVAASIAEQKANGLWVDDKALIVQSAAYGKEKGDRWRLKQVQWRQTEARRPPGTNAPKRWNQGLDGRSYVEVTKGVKLRGHSTSTIRVEEIEWESGMHFQQERYAWISCYGVPLNLWNSDTFRKIDRLWGEVIHLDRDLCNPTSFCCGKVKIVTNVMELINTSLNLKCRGRIYPIRVCEEQSSKEALISCKGTNTEEGDEEVNSNVNGVLQSVAESKREVEDAELEDDVERKNEKAKDVSTPTLKEISELGVGDSCLQLSVVKEAEECMWNSNEIDSGMGDTMIEEESVQQQQMQRCNHELGKVDVIQKEKVQVSSQGFVRSVSETQKGRPGICLEVDLGHGQSQSQPIECVQYKTQGNGLSHPLVSTEGGHLRVGYKSKCNDSISASSGGSINDLIKQGPRKVIKKGKYKYPLVVGGFNGLARRIGQRGVGAGRSRTHQTTMVSELVAVQRPSVDDSHNNSESDKIYEAQATLCLGKSLGIDFKGQDAEIMKKLVQLEEKDKERLGGGA
ncbi:hypothetical protein ACSBR2_026222 [Camellia fascicularis]